jgi:hypothetical protein
MHAPGPPLDPRPALLAEQTGTLLRCHVGTCSSTFTGEGVLAPAILQSESLILNAYPSDLRAEVRHLGFHPDDLGNSNEFMYLRSGGGRCHLPISANAESRQYMRSHQEQSSPPRLLMQIAIAREKGFDC